MGRHITGGGNAMRQSLFRISMTLSAFVFVIIDGVKW
jgi:hypothetical protein